MRWNCPVEKVSFNLLEEENWDGRVQGVTTQSVSAGLHQPASSESTIERKGCGPGIGDVSQDRAVS